MFGAWLLSALLGLNAQAKDVKIVDGVLPIDFTIPTGTFSGTIDRDRAQLTLGLEGRHVVLSYRDQIGGDLLDPRCSSRIGDLQQVNVSREGTVRSATFAFEPNRCWSNVDGRSVTINFREVPVGAGRSQTRADLSLLVRSDSQRLCRIEAGNPRGGQPPHEICDAQPVGNLMTGRFAR